MYIFSDLLLFTVIKRGLRTAVEGPNSIKTRIFNTSDVEKKSKSVLELLKKEESTALDELNACA